MLLLIQAVRLVRSAGLCGGGMKDKLLHPPRAKGADRDDDDN